jgi:hypothetical protein
MPVPSAECRTPVVDPRLLRGAAPAVSAGSAVFRDRRGRRDGSGRPAGPYRRLRRRARSRRSRGSRKRCGSGRGRRSRTNGPPGRGGRTVRVVGIGCPGRRPDEAVYGQGTGPVENVEPNGGGGPDGTTPAGSGPG